MLMLQAPDRSPANIPSQPSDLVIWYVPYCQGAKETVAVLMCRQRQKQG